MRKRMLRLKYEWPEPYDKNLPEVVETARYFINRNDDFRVLCVGVTGTGKTMLSLHALELFMREQASIKHLGIHEKGYATALRLSKDERKSGSQYVMCVNDEAHVLGTEAMTPYNRRLLKLLGEIRGLGIWHWWNTSLPGQLQGAFVDESFDALFFIYTKSEKNPRMYYFLDRDALDKLRQNEGKNGLKAKLSLDLLRRRAKYFATYRGCFRDYHGVLWADYCALKDSKMEDRVDSFYMEFGEEYRTQQQMANDFGVAEGTIRNWVKKGLDMGELKEGVDFIVNAAGKRHFTKNGKEKVRSIKKIDGQEAPEGGVSCENAPIRGLSILSRDGGTKLAN